MSHFNVATAFDRIYTADMETVVSIPEEVFRQAEKIAAALGISRNELYARAIEQFIQHQQPENVTALLDEVYSKDDSSVDPITQRLQTISLPAEKW